MKILLKINKGEKSFSETATRWQKPTKTCNTSSDAAGNSPLGRGSSQQDRILPRSWQTAWQIQHALPKTACGHFRLCRSGDRPASHLPWKEVEAIKAALSKWKDKAGRPCHVQGIQVSLCLHMNDGLRLGFSFHIPPSQATKGNVPLVRS